MKKLDELFTDNSCLNKAKDDEMLFVLLERDAAAPVAIRAWIAERIRLGKNLATDTKLIEAEKTAAYMEEHRDSIQVKPGVDGCCVPSGILSHGLPAPLPNHRGELILVHNEHKSQYMTVAKWCEVDVMLDTAGIGATEWKDEESKQRAIASDDMWFLQWYPDTPVSFYRIAAPTLPELLEYALYYEREAAKGD